MSQGQRPDVPLARAYVLLPLDLLALRATIGVSPRRYFANLVPALLACLAMAFAVWAVSRLPLGDTSLLAASVSVGVAVYLLILRWVAPALLKDLLSKLSLLFAREQS